MSFELFHPWRLSIAPMLDWTDKHYRYFMRLMTRKTRLYTEMVTTGALLHNDPSRFLAHHAAEQPLALQVGGSEPRALEQCAVMAEEMGYAEINLNVGCPSERVQSGKFGACLMAEPYLVAECVHAMQSVVNIPVTIKTRLGIDEQDSYDFLTHFIEQCIKAGCQQFIIHARKAWLNGLSPKENREIPPLCYDKVYQLKKDFAACVFVLNGGIKNLHQAKEQLSLVDGVMLGRAAYQDPYLFADADTLLFEEKPREQSRIKIVEEFIPYMEAQFSQGVRLHSMSRHLLNLFNAQPGARYWRRQLTAAAQLSNAEGFKKIQELCKEYSS